MEEEVAVGHALRLVVNDLLAAFVVVVHHELLLGWKNAMLADRKRQLACIQSLAATKLSFSYNISDRDVTLAELAQTFLLLGAAEAAGGFLELIAVNFDHPEGTEHLGQVGRFVTAEKPELHTSDPASGTEVNVSVLSVLAGERGVCSPCEEDAAVHDGSSDDGHGVAFVLDAVLSHAGVADGHVHALIHH